MSVLAGAALCGTAITLMTPPADAMMPYFDATEDVLVMTDGRELHGQIIEESDSEVVFEVNINGIKSTMSFARSEIADIQRDLVMESADEDDDDRRLMNDDSDDEEDTSFGARRGDANDSSLPAFYVVPMEGQMGTDVNLEVYREMVEDIRSFDPDYIVIRIDSSDIGEGLYPEYEREEVSLDGSEFIDMYRDVINLFHDELRDVPQVAWVVDSVGISTVLALSWDELYLTSDARFGGLQGAAFMFESVRADANKYGKFREAYMAWLRGLVLNSSRDEKLVDAMVRREMFLAATWKGREVEWSLDGEGEYLVDGNPNVTTSFTSRDAENFCISKGTADDLDDLALLLGVREYRVCDGSGREIFEDHVEGWRNSFERAEDALQSLPEIGADPTLDAMAKLGKQKKAWETVLRQIRRYDATAIRLLYKYGLNESAAIIQIEIIEEQIRQIRRSQRGNRGGSRGGGGLGAGG